VPTDADPDTDGELARLLEQLRHSRSTKLGFPGAEDVDFSALLPFFDFELNNIGDPYTDPVFDHHTKPMEREAIEFFADLFRAPPDDRWGYVTSGSTECVQYGMLRARDIYPDGVVYYSTAAHYKVPRVLADFRMPSVAIPADPRGEMNYQALREAVAVNPGRAAIIMATAGTTMTEAVDDLGAITAVLDDLGVLDRYIHVDAALSGVPLAFLPDGQRPRFDFADGADSLGISTHKFLAGRWPGGLVLVTGTPANHAGPRVSYTGAADTVLSCSRNGHTALQLWYSVRTLGAEGLARRAVAARETAAHAVSRLGQIGWDAWRHPHACTVVLRTPPAPLARAWQLATGDDGWSHMVWVPGRSLEQIDQFVAHLQSYLYAAETAQPVPGRWVEMPAVA
jgi:histidine decarboxylase